MMARPFELGRHYPEICEWWRARKWKALPVDALPINGIIIEGEGCRYASIFIWMIESDWAWLDYLVTNPEAPLRKRGEAIQLIVEEAKGFCEMNGRKRIITCLSNPSLIALHERLGFEPGDKGMTTMVCSLKGNFK